MLQPTTKQATAGVAVITIAALLYASRSSLFSAACDAKVNTTSVFNRMFGFFDDSKKNTQSTTMEQNNSQQDAKPITLEQNNNPEEVDLEVEKQNGDVTPAATLKV